MLLSSIITKFILGSIAVASISTNICTRRDPLLYVSVLDGLFSILTTTIIPFISSICKISFLGIKLSKLILFLIQVFYYTIFTVVVNIKLLILFVLGIIFVRALCLDFVKKHKLKRNSIKSFTGQIQLFISNLKRLNYFLILKILIFLIPIRVVIRFFIYILLDGDFYNNANNILAILFSITIIFYISNIIIKKYIKKEKLISKDYYLYNEFVVKNVNLYNIGYILCINQIINLLRLYPFILIIIIYSIIIIILLMCEWKLFWYALSKTETNRLLCIPNVPLSSLTFALTMGHTLQESLENEVVAMECDREYSTDPNFDVNVPPYNVHEQFDPNYNQRIPNPHNPFERRDIVEKTPVHRLALKQQRIHRVLNGGELLKFESCFLNAKFAGWILSLKRGTDIFVYITMLRNDFYSRKFHSFYHFNWDNNNNISDTINHLNKNYGIPFKDHVKFTRAKHLIIFTQAVSIDNGNLLKIYSPSLYSVDMDSLISKWRNYFNMDKIAGTGNNDLYPSESEDFIKQKIKGNLIRWEDDCDEFCNQLRNQVDAQNEFMGKIVYAPFMNKADSSVTLPSNESGSSFAIIKDIVTSKDKGIIEVTGQEILEGFGNGYPEITSPSVFDDDFISGRTSILSSVYSHILKSPELVGSGDEFYGICIRRLSHEYHVYQLTNNIVFDNYILVDPDNKTEWKIPLAGLNGLFSRHMITKTHYNIFNDKDKSSILKLTNFISKKKEVNAANVDVIVND